MKLSGSLSLYPFLALSVWSSLSFASHLPGRAGAAHRRKFSFNPDEALVARATSLPSGWTQKGCYIDATQPNRALNSFNVNSGSLTPPSCIELCSGKGYLYAGVEHGEQCFCGNTIQTGSAGEGSVAAPSGCDVPCTGDASQQCGGSWRILIYQHTTPVALPSGWTQKGCYTDAAYPNRALKAFNTTSSNDTPASCISTCSSKGYQLAGVENGNECYCADSIQTGSSGEGSVAAVTDCDVPCKGDTLQACGGGWRVMIYSSVLSSNAKSTSTSSSSSMTAGPTGAAIHPGASATKCLTALSNANNAAVEIVDCDGSAGQSWTLVGGTLQTFTNKCLDVTSGSTTNGNKMQIYTCSSGNTNQQFTITASTIAWAGKGECLDLTDGNTANGNVIQMWTCMGDQNQVWNIVNGNTPPPPTSATTRTTSTSTTSSHPTTTKTTGKSSTTSTKSTTSSLPTATTKRGLGFSDTDFPQDINLFHTSKIGWVYNWSPNTESYFQGLDFVPMQWNGANIANLAAEVAALHATAVLTFNEPDFSSQSNIDPTTAANLWIQYIEPIRATGVLLGGPAVTSAPTGRTWLEGFLAACKGRCTLDFLPLHWYGEGVGNFYDYIWSMYGEFGYPVWVTEYADTSGNAATAAAFMSDSIAYLDTLDWVQKYAYFGCFRNNTASAVDYAMITADGKLDQLGQIYVSQ